MLLMWDAIADTLPSHQHTTTRLDTPNFKQVELGSEVWLCGHSRFIESDTTVRRFEGRNLGGYTLPHIATFLKA